MSTAIEAEKTHRRLSGLKKNGLVPRSFKGNEKSCKNRTDYACCNP